MNRQESAFRRNFFVVAAIHLGALVAIWFFTHGQPSAPRQDVTWLDGGALSALAKAEPQQSQLEEKEAPTPAPEPEETPASGPPKEAAPPSEIALPSTTPKPTPEETPTPTPTPKPSPKPTPKATPKSTPKPSPKPTAKASPKKSTSPKPKSSASPKTAKHSAEDDEKKGTFLATKDGDESKQGTAVGTGGGNRGGAGHAGGGDKESDFGWYYSMIHDRFYSRWEQPTSIISSDQKFVATVKIRIEKDGRISNVSLANSSGNVVMDESVMAAAHRVTQIDPLPAGLGGDSYEVKINFELSQQSQ